MKSCSTMIWTSDTSQKIPKTSIYDIPYFITDNKLVTKTFGWKPKRDIFEVVNDTYLWLKNNKIKIKKFF